VTPTARRALAVAALVAVAAAAASVVFWLAPRWDEGQGGTFGVRSLLVTTSVDPEGALVGDPVSARASVLVDSDAIDPATVRLSARFAPFGLVRTERAVNEEVGRAALVEVTYTLQCVTVDCLYAMEHVVDGRTVARPIRLRRGTLRARTRNGSVERVSFNWPRVNLRSRLDEQTIDLLETRPAAFRRPDVSYAVSPSSLGWGATGVAVALLLAGGWLVASAVRGRRLVRHLRIPAHLTGVDRALALLEHARATGDVAGERQALERLALELRKEGQPELSMTATRLAWSKDGPRDEALDSFAASFAEGRNGR
jgi:hypothetical protein